MDSFMLNMLSIVPDSMYDASIRVRRMITTYSSNDMRIFLATLALLFRYGASFFLMIFTASSDVMHSLRRTP